MNKNDGEKNEPEKRGRKTRQSGPSGSQPKSTDCWSKATVGSLAMVVGRDLVYEHYRVCISQPLEQFLSPCNVGDDVSCPEDCRVHSLAGIKN